ncbi:712_t:CDS:1, partial [Cetraspora pellucida]
DNDPRQPFILVIITNIIKHWYSLQQADELVYIDAIAGFDVLNILLTLISTNTPIGDLPFATILILNEITTTLIKALNILKHILSLFVFSECGFVTGLQVIMTDNFATKRKALYST